MVLQFVRRLPIVAVLLCLFVWSPNAYGAPLRDAPPNDNFVNAQALTDIQGTVLATNVGATKEVWEAPYWHAGNSGGASIWYTWSTLTEQIVTFDTSSSDFNSLLAVYTWPDPNAGLVTVPSTDPAYPANTTSTVTFDAAAGVLYYIAVDGFNGATGNVVLNWGPSPQVSVPPAAPPAPAPPVCAAPVIAGFSVDNAEIKRGDTATLSWGLVSNATSAVIDNGIGGVPTPGQQSVRPDKDTTFTLTANGCGGAVTSQVSIKVDAIGHLNAGIPQGPEDYQKQLPFDWSNQSGYDGDKYLSNIEIQIQKNGSYQPFETKENFELPGNGYKNQKAFPQGKYKIRFRWWMSDRKTHQRISFKSDWSVICIGYDPNATCK